MFINNKYTSIYYQIVNRVKDRRLSCYKEKHHIIPKSLGGNNDASNIVELTAREHFICHLLLTKMLLGTNKKKMTFAVWLLCNAKNSAQQERHVPNSITYEKIRIAHATNVSQQLKGVKKTKIYWLNKKHTEKTKLKQSLVKIGKLNPMFGKKHTEETLTLQSQSQIGIPKPIFICECCGASVGGKSNLLRWHNSNCKETQNY